MTTRLILAAAALLPATAAAAQADTVVAPQATIPDMARFIEWRADGDNALYIRAYNGRWYYATTRDTCRRLGNTQRLSFRTKFNGDLDRTGAVIAEGWRCQLSSVVESDGPPPRQ